MISLKNVSKWYGHFQVLTDCSTEVKKGEVVVVCASGSGKSTLIKTVNGLEPVQQGEIIVNGTRVNDKKTNLAKLRSNVGMVFQHFELFPHLSIIENLTLAQVKVLKRDKAAAREKGLKLLERVVSPPMPINSRRSCPAASSSAWRLPVRSVWIPSRCSLMSRPPPLIRR